MAVFIISWALHRKVEGVDEFRTIQQAVKGVDSSMEAAEAVGDAFPQTDEAKAGWKLLGPPCALEVTHPRVNEWQPYIRPEPVNIPRRPAYLRPVDD